MIIRKGLTMGILAVLLVGMLAFAFPGGSVAAQAPTPQPQKDPQVLGARIDKRLEKAFHALQKIVDKQAQNIERANIFIGKVEGLIAKAKANGKDTAVLEAAVAAFKIQQTEAVKFNNAAADILKIHAGFDANGKVINRDLAKQTLQDGHEQVKAARSTFTDALKKLHEVFKAWREANPAPPKK